MILFYYNLNKFLYFTIIHYVQYIHGFINYQINLLKLDYFHIQ